MIVSLAAGDLLGAERSGGTLEVSSRRTPIGWADNSSLYSSANNHRVAEGLGLLVAGLLIPMFPAPAPMFRLGAPSLPRRHFRSSTRTARAVSNHRPTRPLSWR